MKALILVFGVAVLAGCSSQPKVSRLLSDQYCFTNQTIDVEDKSVVSSKTQIKCSDDPIEKYVPARMGVAKDCTRHYVSYNVNGRIRTEELIACKKFDGVSDVIESRTIR